MSAEVEPDRLQDFPHPREARELVGQPALEQAFLDALAAGRLHHAWLIAGPEGVGKATFAYRAARFVLAHGGRLPPGVLSLDVAPEHRVSRQVLAGSHPNLFVLRRMLNREGKLQSEVAVDAARRLVSFFTTSPADGDWRIALIDAADDLNRNSANALLKLVEEPPQRSLFFIIAHRIGLVLPTIRSRCRLIRAEPLAPAELTRVLRNIGLDAEAIGEAALLRAGGSVRAALEYAGEADRALIATLEGLLAGPSPARLIAFAEKFAGARNDDAFGLFMDVVLGHLSGLLRNNAGRSVEALEPLARLWNKLNTTRAEVESYNLDRRPFVIATINDAAEVTRSLA